VPERQYGDRASRAFSAVTDHRYMDLKFFLEDLIGRPVDLVTKAALKTRSRGTIEREAVRVS
jgi:predicted nucleotidyltransferase